MAEWINVNDRLPSEAEFVLAIVSGKCNNITFEESPVIATCYGSGEWDVDYYPDMKNLTVHCWQPICYPGENWHTER